MPGFSNFESECNAFHSIDNCIQRTQSKDTKPCLSRARECEGRKVGVLDVLYCILALKSLNQWKDVVCV